MNIIDFLFVILLFYTAFCSIKSVEIFGVWVNHYVLTNFFWVFSLGLSLYFNDYNRPLSQDVYIIFFAGLFVFNITLFTSKIPKIPNNIIINKHSILRRRVLELVVILIALPVAYYNFMLIRSGVSLWEINNDYWNENRNAGPYILNAIEQNIISPLMYVLMATCFYTYYDNRKRVSSGILTIAIGTLCAILHVFVTGGGRFIILKTMYIYVLSTLAWYNMKKTNLVFKLNKTVLIVLVITALGAIGWASLHRGRSEGLYEILSGRLTLFPALFESYYLNTEICEGYTWGYSMFEMPVSIIMYPFKMLGFQIGVPRMSGIEHEFVYVPALDSMANAYVSAYLFYMRDFGYWGVVIGPFLVGTIYNLLWRICRKEAFLLLFYFVGIGMTCLNSSYPFKRGFIFLLLFVYLYRKFVRQSQNSIIQQRLIK